MKYSLLSSLLFSLGLLATPDGLAQTTIPASFFPAGEFQAILAQPGCRGIRVYPVFDEQRETNATMLIGIDGNGNEIQNDTVATARYRMYTGIHEDVPTSRTLSRGEAQGACSAFNANHSPFVSDMGSSLLAAHLGGESEGILLSHTSSNGNNFQANGYRSESGLQGFGTASLGDPCPTNCGSRSQYLCSPN